MKKTNLRLTMLVVVMFLDAVIFVCILLFLTNINTAMQMFLSALLIFIFCFLGASLLVMLLSKYKNGNKKHKIICENTVVLSGQQLCKDLLKNGFSICDNENLPSGTMFLRKVVHNKGAYITDAFIQEGLPNEDDLANWEHKLYTVSEKMDIGFSMQVIRQKNIIVCVFDSNVAENLVEHIVSRFSYLFSVFLPIVFDAQKVRLYHVEIPMDVSFAKGKALVDLRSLISSILYNPQSHRG